MTPANRVLIQDAIEILLIATVYSSEFQAKRTAVLQGLMDLLKEQKLTGVKQPKGTK